MARLPNLRLLTTKAMAIQFFSSPNQTASQPHGEDEPPTQKTLRSFLRFIFHNRFHSVFLQAHTDAGNKMPVKQPITLMFF